MGAGEARGLRAGRRAAAAGAGSRARQTGMEPPFPRDRGMDERELRKTADRVYRLIEERLRKELRRGGR